MIQPVTKYFDGDNVINLMLLRFENRDSRVCCIYLKASIYWIQRCSKEKRNSNMSAMCFF